MFIEIWNDGSEIINTDHVARLRAANGMTEIQFSHAPWDLPDNYRQGDPLEQVINVVLFETPYADFKLALLSGKNFYSLIREPLE